MTFEQIVQNYIDLLIIQYQSKPKARSMLKLYISTIFFNGNFLFNGDFKEKILQALNYKTAIGNSLTRIAKEEGVNRYNAGVYINDDDLRTLLTFKIIANNTNLTQYNIDNLLFQFFGNDVVYIWNQNMTIFIRANYPNNLLEMSVNQNILPVPINVGFTIFINTFDIVFVDNTDINAKVYPYNAVRKEKFALVITI